MGTIKTNLFLLDIVLVRIEQKGNKGMVHATSQQHTIVRELCALHKGDGARYFT